MSHPIVGPAVTAALHLSATGTRLYVAVQAFGAPIGFLLGAYLADAIGRKWTFMTSAVATIIMVLVYLTCRSVTPVCCSSGSAQGWTASPRLCNSSVEQIRNTIDTWQVRALSPTAENTSIEWTDTTWNPVTGCTKISAGCDNCYAARFSERFRGVAGHPFQNGFDLTIRPERLLQPLAWKKPRMIFVNSMSDLFHKGVPKITSSKSSKPWSAPTGTFIKC